MKKTLLIIALFIALGNVNAQSDATKEETLDWLNTYLAKYSRQATIESYGNDFTRYKVRIDQYEDGIIYRELESEKRDDLYAHKMELTFLRLISINQNIDGDTFIINFYGKDDSVTKKRTCSACGTSTGREIPFIFSNKSEAERVFKALKHLFSFYNQKIVFTNNVSDENKF
tara:strand:- start:1895 stop:2410 length:516 start_codon:yes stop_codon:yes gene_type:complete